MLLLIYIYLKTLNNADNSLIFSHYMANLGGKIKWEVYLIPAWLVLFVHCRNRLAFPLSSHLSKKETIRSQTLTSRISSNFGRSDDENDQQRKSCIKIWKRYPLLLSFYHTKYERK